MGLLDLTAEKPAPGDLGDAVQIANAFTEIENAVNHIDASNFTPGVQVIPLSSLQQGGALPGQALVWDGSQWAPGGFPVPIGSIFPFGGMAAPTGFLLCDGHEESRFGATQPLFNVLSTRFGVGNGSTTFNLPDLKGRIPVAPDGSAEFPTPVATPSSAFKAGHKLLQSHGHVVNSHNHGGGNHAHGGGTGGRSATHQHFLNFTTDTSGYTAGGRNANQNVLIDGAIGNTYDPLSEADFTEHSHAIGAEANIAPESPGTDSAGGGNAQNLQPYLVVHYIIKS